MAYFHYKYLDNDSMNALNRNLSKVYYLLDFFYFTKFSPNDKKKTKEKKLHA